ncbi:MAG: type I 3-dehydroquinate dehydratase [Clostridiales bacterium]|nr:type I 3-dehydroquinate dehydratase [Clostridiales bacterium]
MICVSVGTTSFAACRRIIKNLDCAEIRLDKARFCLEEVREIFSSHSNLIATFRPGAVSEKEREGILLEAIRSGAKYVDLELESSKFFKQRILREARQRGCQVIMSYHDFRRTPAKEKLRRAMDKCFSQGADIVKIACQVNSRRDVFRILSLYENQNAEQGRIVALGMGEKGKLTRVAALLLGSPLTYASLKEGSETAEGQIDYKSLKKILSLLKAKRI